MTKGFYEINPFDDLPSPHVPGPGQHSDIHSGSQYPELQGGLVKSGAGASDGASEE